MNKISTVVIESINGKPLNKMQRALYECMKLRYEKGETFTRDDLMKIYKPVNRRSGRYEPEDSQKYLNASLWFDRALARLIRMGYLGLSFRK